MSLRPRQWSYSVVINPLRQIEKLHKQLNSLAAGVQTDRTKLEAMRLQSELEKLYFEKEVYWRQRSKTQWAREGDRNTQYSHSKASAQKCANQISGLLNSNRVWCEEAKDMEHIIQDYLAEIFSLANPSETLMDEILASMNPRVCTEMNRQLTNPFTTSKLHFALSHMTPLKSPGPDGFSAIFFQKYWHLLGFDISSCILDFMNNHSLPASLNYTFIVIIPKVSSPKKITEFRPISLCNVVYIVGSKMVANSIKSFLNDIVSPT